VHDLSNRSLVAFALVNSKCGARESCSSNLHVGGKAKCQEFHQMLCLKSTRPLGLGGSAKKDSYRRKVLPFHSVVE
jgi:hypothetical protein